MPDEISYARMTLDTPNPIARFTHRRRYAVSLKFAQGVAHQDGTVLDYGCGVGHFLHMLADQRPDLKLIGYDPYTQHGDDAYLRVRDLEAVQAGTVDLLTCFETIEHLDPPEIDQFLVDAGRLLAKSGQLLVSVPIIGGPPVLLKEANQMLLFRRRSHYRAGELLATAFRGRPAERAADVKTSHKGFDFRSVPALLAAGGFTLTDTRLSPFSALPWWTNSQAFYVFARSS